MYTDADLAGDRNDTKSSNGYFMCLAGPNTSFPLTFGHKKQGCTATSTPEAELVSLAYGLKNFAVPALSLWDTLLECPTTLRGKEDNEAAIGIAQRGITPPCGTLIGLSAPA